MKYIKEFNEYSGYSQNEVSDIQRAKAEELKKELIHRGYGTDEYGDNYIQISTSKTNFGVSTYVIFQDILYNKERKFRISDHHVSNIGRMFNEYHVSKDQSIDSILNMLESDFEVDSKNREMQIKKNKEKEERELLLNNKWDLMKDRFKGFIFKKNDRTYQDYDTFRSKGNYPRTNIYQKELQNTNRESVYSYEWTEPTEYDKFGHPTNFGNDKPSFDFIENYSLLGL